jgi:hypothetical protein
MQSKTHFLDFQEESPLSKGIPHVQSKNINYLKWITFKVNELHLELG